MMKYNFLSFYSLTILLPYQLQASQIKDALNQTPTQTMTEKAARHHQSRLPEDPDESAMNLQLVPANGYSMTVLLFILLLPYFSEFNIIIKY
jgi:hypothetical protein